MISVKKNSYNKLKNKVLDDFNTAGNHDNINGTIKQKTGGKGEVHTQKLTDTIFLLWVMLFG